MTTRILLPLLTLTLALSACQKTEAPAAPGILRRWVSKTFTLLDRNQQTGAEKIYNTSAWDGVIVLEVRADSIYVFARSKSAEAAFGYDLGVFVSSSGSSGRIRKYYNVLKGKDQYGFANGTFTETLEENSLRIRSGYGGGGGGPITYAQVDLIRER
ncbi:MAG: hypothetical protein H7Y12_13595 [Sphingobacteriaceae bacterium]|nr:hypothetical protein [Cytophagaceae bacterium]